MSDTPNNAIPYVPQDTLDPAAGLNDAINVIDALLNTRVINMTTAAPPGGPSDGDMYVVGAAPTGDWAGHANAFARYVADGAFWQFYEAGVQAWLVLNKADGNLYKWDGATWAAASGLADAPTDGTLYGRQSGSWTAIPNPTEVVKTVNGEAPDTNGNVEVTAAGAILSVNGETPDSNGNVQVATGGIETVNGIGPDTHGGVELPLYQLAGLNDQTGTTYNLAASDVGKEIRCTNASAITVTVLAQATVDTPDHMMAVISQGGAGAVTIAAGAGVTLRTPNGAATAAQYDARVIQHISGDEWRVW